MLTFRNWYAHEHIFDFGVANQIQITEPPKQYPITKMILTITGVISIGAVGAANYVAAAMFLQRIVRNISFKLGASNLLKDIPGYAAWEATNILWPGYGTWMGPADGSTMATTVDYPFIISYVINFADPDTIQSNWTTLMPSLYQDIMLTVDFNAITDITTAGDYDATLQAMVSVMVEQDNDLAVAPNDSVREWFTTKLITETGYIEFELPTTYLIERMHIWLKVDGAPDFWTVAEGDNPLQINVENGALILYEALYQDFMALSVFNMGTLAMTGNNACPLMLNPNHDLFKIFDNRKVSKWTLRLPVTYDPLAVSEVGIHYFGRSPKSI